MKELKKKNSTKKLVKALGEKYKKTNKAIWSDLAERLSKPSKRIKGVNVEKIGRLAKKNKGKILVVPGKVLGTGDLKEKSEVSAFQFSEKAREKINAKGKAIDLWQLMESKKKENQMIIIK